MLKRKDLSSTSALKHSQMPTRTSNFDMTLDQGTGWWRGPKKQMKVCQENLRLNEEKLAQITSW